MANKKPGPGKDLTRAEWKKRYGSDTQYYTHLLNRVDLTTGKTIRSLIEASAKKHNLDPAFLASGLFTEGLDRYNVLADKYGSTKDDYYEYPISGMKHLGLDTVGNIKNDLFRKGYVDPKEYKENVREWKTENEKDNVISGDFKRLDIAIDYVAAFQRNENDNIDKYLKENDIELTPIQKTFFQNVAYNFGPGGVQQMIKSYNDKGFLKDNKFIYEKPNEFFKEPYTNAYKRTTAGIGLKEQAGFSENEVVGNPYSSTKNAEVVSSIEAQGLQGIEAVKAVDKHRESVLAANKLDPEGLVPREADKLTAAGIERAPKVKQKPMEFTPTGLVSTKATPVVATNTNIPLKEVSRTKTKSASTLKSTGVMAKKTKPTPSELALKEQFVTNMQKALGQHESNNQYDAQNPTSTAAGKYQFTEMWLSKDGKAAEKSIQAFAERNGMPIPQSLDEFKTMPGLQDSYFKYYAKEVLYPKAMEAVSSLNPKGITMEQAGALVHLRGEAKAIKEISTGNFSKATEVGVDGAKHKNPSSISYMNSIATKVGQPITPEQLTAVQIDAMPQAEKDKISKDYFTAKDRIINYEDLDDVDKNRQIAQLNSEYKSKGYLPIVNDHITKRNEGNAVKAKAQDDKIKAGVAEYQKWGEKSRVGHIGKGLSSTGSITLGGPAEAKEFKAWAKANGVKVSGGTNFIYNFNPQEFGKAGIKAVTGKDSFSPEQLKIIEGKAGDQDGAVISNTASKDFFSENNFRKIAGWFTGEKAGVSGPMGLVPEAVAYTQNLNSYTEIDTLDGEQIADLPTEEKAPLKEEPVKATTKTTDTDGTDAAKTSGLAKEGESLLDQWGKNVREDLARKKAEGEGKSYNKEDFKKEIPFDAITGMALGLNGLEQARDTKIPKRTEEVTEAYRNFAAQLAKKSKEGLPPSVEAAMKAQLAEGLQGGLANIVNASGGNRALVLGNLGGLEKSKAQGIVDMQLADYEAKEQAFKQYGEALKYQNDFKARKDVANHSIDYQEALKRRSDGEDLAQAGFAQMINGLKYQKENGPGSINHMKKSWLEQEMFGFAIDAKPDAPNSQESYHKRKAEFKEYSGLQLQALEKKAALNPQQQEMAKEFISQGGSEKDQANLINYLYDNPQKIKMDVTKFPEAKERQDFGLMFSDADKALPEMSKPEKIESPAIQELQAFTKRNTMPGRAAAENVSSLEPMGLAGFGDEKKNPNLI